MMTVEQCLGYIRDDMGVSGDIPGCLGGSLQFPSILGSHNFTNEILHILQYPWRSQMSQISKFSKVTVVLTYCEAPRKVSEKLTLFQFCSTMFFVEVEKSGVRDRLCMYRGRYRLLPSHATRLLFNIGALLQ